MIEKPTQARAIVTPNGNSIEIRIPSRKNWLLTSFVFLWLVGFTIGGRMMLDNIQSTAPAIFNDFIIFGIGGWLVGALCGTIIILWCISGIEIIKVNEGILEIKKQIFSLGISKKYQIDAINRLTINQTSDSGSEFQIQGNFFNMSKGVIKFDYGMKTIKFGSEIDEAEGRRLIEVLKRNSNFNSDNFA